MRKQYLILVLFMLVLILASQAKPVDEATAKKLAENFWMKNHVIKTEDGQWVRTNPPVPDFESLSGRGLFKGFYIFNNRAGKGFVIVSADDCVKPVLGYSYDNNFVVENMPEHISDWFKGYERQIQSAIEQGLQGDDETKEEWMLLRKGEPLPANRDGLNAIAPLIQTHWNQVYDSNSEYPPYYYNYSCPYLNSVQCPTGCVATAMAQVMYYWEWPKKGFGAHKYQWMTNYGIELSTNFNYTYDWELMQEEEEDGDFYGKIAGLMYDCGIAVNMEYNTANGGSASNDVYATQALNTHFDFTALLVSRSIMNNDDLWDATLYSILNKGIPLLYYGVGNKGGHAFVCDGMDLYMRFHFNWGWGGAFDGYYYTNALTPGTNGPYNNNQTIVVAKPSYLDIKDDALVSVGYDNTEITLSASTSNQQVFLSWNPSDYESEYFDGGYEIYRNNALIARTSATSYIDKTAPSGSNTYYVKRFGRSYINALSKYVNIPSIVSSSKIVNVSSNSAKPAVSDLAADVLGARVTLNWTTPEWYYRGNASAVLSANNSQSEYDTVKRFYVETDTTKIYYAHRYPASSLAQYNGKALYRVSTYAFMEGEYEVRVYTRSKNGQPDPESLAACKSHYFIGNGWVNIDLDTPVILTGEGDLWIVLSTFDQRVMLANYQMQDVSNIQTQFASFTYVPCFCFNAHNNACYNGFSPTALGQMSGIAWLIKTYIGDYTYSHNLYRNNVLIAENIDANTYVDAGLQSGHYEYCIKTNYPNGTVQSNVAVVDIGEIMSVNIAASVNQVGSGTVSGSGLYDQGSYCTLNATALSGYYFLNWTINGEVVSSEREYTFLVENATTVVANFAPIYQENLTVPASICAGEALHLSTPSVAINVDSQGWQLSGSSDFSTVSSYTGQLLEQSFNAYYLRNWVCIGTDTAYSNAVQIAVNPVYEVDLWKEECDNYTWNNEVFSASGVYKRHFNSVSGCDSLVLLHLTINNSVTNNIEASACETYNWNGVNYTNSGNYNQTFTSVSGCDSVVTLHLAIGHPVESEFSKTACNYLVWNNVTYTKTGDYTQTFNSHLGCDSVVTMHLVINPSKTHVFDTTVCGGFAWYGQNIPVEGSYTNTFSTVIGCDSVVTMNVQFYESEDELITKTVCDSYLWYGNTYSASGTYTHNSFTDNGCAKTETLNLTINNSVSGEIEDTACETYNWNGVNYTNSGNYNQTFTSASGCDSVVTLHLTIGHPVESEFNKTACNYHVWNNVTYTNTGDYTQTFNSYLGCDSVVTMHLVINPSKTHVFDTTVCGGFAWYGQNIPVEGSYTSTFSTVNGCDSVVTMNVQFYESEDEETTIVACDSYQWYGNTYSVNGTYTHNSVTDNGCYKNETLYLTINVADEPTISGNNQIMLGESTTLTSSDAAGYLWNTGETTQSITVSPVANAVYNVTITDVNGCSASAEIEVVVTDGIVETTNDINIYPNPTKGVFTVEVDGIINAVVFDMYGQAIVEKTVDGNVAQIDLNGFAKGQYLVRVSTDNGVFIKKIVKE